MERQHLRLSLLLCILACLVACTHGQTAPCPSPPCRPEGVAPDCPDVERVTSMVQQLLDTLQSRMPQVSAMVEEMGAMSGKLDGLESQLQQLNQDVSALTPPEAYRPRYRVFHFESPLGEYRLNLTEARELCASKNMKLATVTQLEAAYRHGLNMCSCGWIDDGTSRYAVQYPENWCGGRMREAGIVFCEWQSTWNAYCFDSADLQGDDENQ